MPVDAHAIGQALDNLKSEVCQLSDLRGETGGKKIGRRKAIRTVRKVLVSAATGICNVAAEVLLPQATVAAAAASLFVGSAEIVIINQPSQGKILTRQLVGLKSGQIEKAAEVE